jgi:RNA polymerase sigma-70 factor (ECF subfamily)
MDPSMDRVRIEELFARFRDLGDVAALGEVFDATAPDLLRVARRITRDRGESEDVLQSTFLAAIEGAHGFDRHRELRPWLVGILVRQAGLARRRRGAPIPSGAVGPKRASDPADALVAREISESIALALEKLSPEDREVLVPLLVDGRRAVDIARELDRRPDTISMRIHRGLARLRRLLAPGIGLGWMAALLSRRGLAAMRRNVLLHAEQPATSLAVTASAGIGGTILVNKLILSAGAVSLTLAGAWLLVHRDSTGSRDHSNFDPDRSSLSGVDELAAERGIEVADSAGPAGSLRAAVGALPARVTTLEIVDPDGHPAIAAAVVIAQDGKPVRDLQTDAAGRVELGIGGETVRAYVLRPRTMPLREELVLDGEEHRLELPRGRELSGRVTVGGKPPEQRIAIHLTFDVPPFRSAPERSEIARRLGCEETEGMQLKGETEEDGAFHWFGLPEDWTGGVGFPWGYALASSTPQTYGEKFLRLDAPVVGLSVELDKLPCLRGRVVDAADGSAVPKAKISCAVEWAGIQSSTMTGATADDSGRFEIPLKQRELARVEISWVTDAAGRRKARPGLQWGALVADYDLGEIAVEPVEGRPVEFIVRDSGGHPIAGAVGIAGNAVSRPTDEAGRGALEFVGSGIDRLSVGAHGFWARAQGIPPERDVPVPITLEVGNELDVEVAGLQASSIGDTSLHLVSASPLFVNLGGWLPGSTVREVLAGSCQVSYPAGDDRTRGFVICGLDEEGRFAVEDLKPGEPLTLQVLGPFDNILHDEDLAPLGPTEHRHVAIRIAESGHRVSGRVLSEDGAAIPRAYVRLEAGDRHAVARTTGRDGEFSFPSLPGGEIKLSVVKRGWVPYEVRLVVGDSSPGSSDIRLQPGHDVTIDVLDANDQRVREVRAWARDPTTGRTWQGQVDRSWRIHLDDLPPISFKVSVAVAGDVIERMHDALVPRMRVDLPTLGSVEVRWSRPASSNTDQESGGQIVLRPVDPAHGPVKHWCGTTLQGSHRFQTVFPGEYAVAFEKILRYGAEGAPDFVEPIGSPVRVVVEADRTVTVNL